MKTKMCYVDTVMNGTQEIKLVGVEGVDISDGEVYAPFMNNGDRVRLYRYPLTIECEPVELSVNNSGHSDSEFKHLKGNSNIGISFEVQRKMGFDSDGDAGIIDILWRVDTFRLIRLAGR